MAGNTIGAKIVLDGEADYRKALKNINTEQKELRSEMKLASSAFSEQQNSVETLTKKNEILSKQYEKQEEKVEIYSKAVADSAKKQEEAGSKVAELKDSLEKANKKLDEMASSSDTSAEALDEQKKVIEELKDKLSLAEDGYAKAKNATANWQTSLNNAQVDLDNLGQELAQNQSYLEEAKKSMDGCASSIDEYGNNVEAAKKKTSTFADVLKAELCAEAIKQGIEALATGMKKVVDASVSVGSSFEAGMSQVAATMGMTSEEIAEGCKDYETLKVAAEESGKATKYSATQAAEALNYLALAGYDASKAAETLPRVLNLAAAGGMELAYASDLVTDAMAALGMETSDLDNYIDEMAKTSQKSNTNVAQLGEATLVCAGTIALTKQPLETMNAELGVLANNGIKGAEGGTHLRNILLSLVSPTDKGAKALQNYGIAVTDSAGNVRDLNDIMIDMNNSLSSLSDSDKTNVISTIFNKTDIAAVNALLKGTGKEFDNLYAELQSCEGAAADMAETMEANLTGKITILESALEGLGISAYEKIEGTLKDSVDAATESVNKLQKSMDSGELGRAMDDFTDSLGDAAEGAIGLAEDALPVLIEGLTWLMDNSEIVVSGIAGITAANMAHGTVVPVITAAMEAWQAYKKANEGATIAQWALNGAMNANPAGLLITAIAGLTSAVAVNAMLLQDATKAEQEFIEAAEQECRTLNDNVATREKTLKSKEIELSVIDKLKEELLDLNEKEFLSTKEKERMKLIVDELNEAMPELNLSINEQTGYLEQTNEELDNYVENMKKSLKVSFMQEDLEEIVRDLYEAENSLEEVREKRTEAEESLAKTTAEYNEYLKENKDTLNECAAMYADGITPAMQYESKISEMNNLIAQLDEQENNLNQTMEGLNSEYDTMNEKINSVVNPINNATGALEDANQVTITYKDTVYSVTQQVAQDMQELEDAYSEAFETALDTLNGQAGLFEELSIKSDMSTQQMAQNLKSQTDTFTTYKDDLTTAAKLVEDGLMEEGLLGSIMDLGVNGAGYLHELVAAAETDTEQFSKLMEEWASMETAKLQLSDTMADIESGYSEQMEALIKLSEASMESVETAITEGGSEVVNATANVASESVKGAETELDIVNGSSKKFELLGKYMSKGMETGILKEKDSAVKAATSLAQESYEAAKKELDVHSPSKKFAYLGEMSVEGYDTAVSEGLTETAENIQEALNEIWQYDYSDTLEAHEEIVDSLDNVQEKTEELQDSMEEMIETTENVTEATDVSGDAVNGAISILGSYINAVKGAAIATKESVEEFVAAYEDAQKASESSLNSQAKLFENIKIESDKTVKDMIEGLDSQVAAFNQYKDELLFASSLVAAGLLDSGLLGAIEELGISGAGYLHELVLAANTDTDEYNRLMLSWAEMQDAKTQLADTTTYIKLSQSEFMNDLITMQHTKNSEMSDEVESTSEETIQSVEELMNSLVAITDDGIGDVTKTVKTKAPEVEKTSEELCSGAIDGANEILQVSEDGTSLSFVSIGYSIPQGVAQGIMDGQQLVSDALQYVIDNAIDSIDLSGITAKINRELGDLY